jgi:hypothetical protein
MDAAPITWRPLGRLLVDKGLLSDEELERALEEQEFTGKRLGEILIERGYLTTPTLSNALAEQYGVDLDFERGFGSGLRDEIERRHQAKRPVLRIVRQNAEPEIVEVPGTFSVDEVVGLRDRLAEAESRLAELLPHLEEQWARLAEAQARIAELEAAESAAVPVADDERIPELEAQLAEARVTLVARDARFAALEAQLEAMIAAQPDPAPEHEHEQEPEPETSHLLFVPGPGGYAIAESEGAAPDPGARIELDGAPYLVSRQSAAPFPGDRRRCAYLVAEAQAAAVGVPEGEDSSLGNASSL